MAGASLLGLALFLEPGQILPALPWSSAKHASLAALATEAIEQWLLNRPFEHVVSDMSPQI
jgi:hypothetical protein